MQASCLDCMVAVGETAALVRDRIFYYNVGQKLR